MYEIKLGIEFINDFVDYYMPKSPYFINGIVEPKDLYLIKNKEVYEYANHIHSIKRNFIGKRKDIIIISDNLKTFEDDYKKYICSDDTAYILFKFPDEETAFYFKLKFC